MFGAFKSRTVANERAGVFLFAFLPVTYAVFWTLRSAQARYVWLTLTGYVFYGYWDSRFCLLILMIWVSIDPQESDALGIAQRQVADGSRSLYAGQGVELSHELLVEVSELLRLIALTESQIEGHGRSRKTGVDGHNIDVAANEKAGACEQDDHHGSLRHDEGALQPAVTRRTSARCV